MLLDGEEWRDMFGNFSTEAWRLEALPQYLVPQEAGEITAYRAGKRVDPDTYSSAYIEKLKSQRAEGKSKGRVHIVTRPLSEYLRFEFSRYYRPHVKAGEDIRILDVTERDNPLGEAQDFWLFDRSTVVLMNYAPDGTQIDRKLFDGDVTPYLEYQRIALAESVPFEEYVKGLDVRP